jgi:hypothetical protein
MRLTFGEGREGKMVRLLEIERLSWHSPWTTDLAGVRKSLTPPPLTQENMFANEMGR